MFPLKKVSFIKPKSFFPSSGVNFPLLSNFWPRTVHCLSKSTRTRLAANPSISSIELAKLVADDVKYLLEELALNYRYFVPKKL